MTMLKHLSFIMAAYAAYAASVALLISASASAAGPAPRGQNPDRYVLTFAEEFSDGFDPERWNDHIWYDESNRTTNYAVEEGKLKIWPERDADENFFNRTIDTDGRFSQAYGYFEMEAKLPVGRGTWPAFWLFNHAGEGRPEIDIMEAYPGGSKEGSWSVANQHPAAFAATVWQDPAVPSGEQMILTPDLSAGFHQYGMKWESDGMTFYFDGKEVYRAHASINDPLYILLDLWFGSASGTPDDTTPTGKGNAFEINYVRAWQFR
jgi:beta-glucanase (GH16 family)